MNLYARLRSSIASAAAAREVGTWVRDYLTPVAAGTALVPLVRHPLGFLCFPVWRGGDLGICLHVWAEGMRAQPTTSPVHAHSWDLLSIVLYGAVANDVFEVIEAPERPTHRVFEIQSGADGDLIRATSQVVAYHRRSHELFRAGDAYTLPHGVFHVSEVAGAAATVALGEYRHGKPDRSLGGLATDDHWVHRIPCTAAETRRVAQTVLDQLTQPAHLEEQWDRATS
ncbi:hypothetical protein [Nocardia goodfellowii]|uniref:Uncharacterized protein n=1 Tax=Nocardia goodfellowii TaxID=882446 RepID=A0ABS4QG67_9NOCA|nr:hypothetical protein [Nocardia goodfellowii]MBP2190695.1 hypothetical protein [Nocardia goodfellowii]